MATEWGWGREEFLGETCIKAGCEPDCWRKEETEVYTFEALVFGS